MLSIGGAPKMAYIGKKQYIRGEVADKYKLENGNIGMIV